MRVLQTTDDRVLQKQAKRIALMAAVAIVHNLDGSGEEEWREWFKELIGQVLSRVGRDPDSAEKGMVLAARDFLDVFGDQGK